MSIQPVCSGKADSSVIQKVVKELHLSQMSCFLFRRKNSALKLSTHEHAPSNLYVRAHTSGKDNQNNNNNTAHIEKSQPK